MQIKNKSETMQIVKIVNSKQTFIYMHTSFVLTFTYNAIATHSLIHTIIYALIHTTQFGRTALTHSPIHTLSHTAQIRHSLSHPHTLYHAALVYRHAIHSHRDEERPNKAYTAYGIVIVQCSAIYACLCA